MAVRRHSDEEIADLLNAHSEIEILRLDDTDVEFFQLPSGTVYRRMRDFWLEYESVEELRRYVRGMSDTTCALDENSILGDRFECLSRKGEILRIFWEEVVEQSMDSMSLLLSLEPKEAFDKNLRKACSKLQVSNCRDSTVFAGLVFVLGEVFIAKRGGQWGIQRGTKGYLAILEGQDVVARPGMEFGGFLVQTCVDRGPHVRLPSLYRPYFRMELTHMGARSRRGDFK